MDAMQNAEINRRLENLIRLGTVDQADYASARLKVRIGELVTGWLPWLTHRAGGDRSWWAPEVGEQVVLLSPGGDLAQGIVLPSLYRDAHPAPGTDPAKHTTRYQNGTEETHDRAAQHYHLNVPAGGKITLQVGNTTLVLEDGQTKLTTPKLVVDSPDSTFTGDVTAQGLLTYLAGMIGQGGAGATASISGSVDVTGGDVTVDGISSKHHTHPGDSGGTTGEPQ
ncbi:phage baseplate assembly protein V [Guyparkeria sp. GHLCS8-2]|uniref:phage baseplate assembly protein V n=1 Tax=Guyparkeria halopsychrophila TaxID=3139421 RepID=UPI0037CCBE88